MRDGIQKIDALVLDPDADSRSRIKQATAAVPTFGRVIPAASFTEARARVEAQGKYIVIFISSGFLADEKSKQAMFKFITESKQTSQGQDSAYIMVLRAEHQKNSTIALGTLSGVDSFLTEPFSVDSLVETTTLAHSLYKQRKHAREEKMIDFLVRDVLRNLDSYVLNIKLGNAPGNGLRAIRDGMSAIASLEPHMLNLYFAALMSQAEKAAPMQATKRTSATEKAMARLKQRFSEQGLNADALQKPAPTPSSSGPRIIIRK